MRSVECGHLTPTQHLGQLGPEFLVLLDKPVKFRFDLVEEGVDFLFVVAGPEPGRAELLVPHIRGRQWHLVSLARRAWCVEHGASSMVPCGRYPIRSSAPRHPTGQV